MLEKTTIALILSAGALLSGVVTAETAMATAHLLFVKGGRIGVPAERCSERRAQAILPDPAGKVVSESAEPPAT
jgi:hypothetical protein